MATTERGNELRAPGEPLPPGATPVSKKRGFWAWLNKRLPVDEFIANQLTGYYAPKNFNIWYFFGSLAMLVLVIQLVTGIFLAMFYKPSAARCVRLRAIHHARGRLGLADPLHPLHRRIGVLHRRLPAHVPRHDVRLVPAAAGAAVADRHAGVPRAHGRGLHGLRAALGQHVLLGRAGDRQHLRHRARHRTGTGAVDPRRLRHRRCDAEPLLRAARRGGAASSCCCS